MNILLLISMLHIGGCCGGSCSRQPAAPPQPTQQQVIANTRVAALQQIYDLRRELKEARKAFADDPLPVVHENPDGSYAPLEPSEADTSNKEAREETRKKCAEIQGKIDAIQDMLVASHRYELQHTRYPAASYRTDYGFIQAAQRAAIYPTTRRIP
jgi:hypothetical protein